MSWPHRIVMPATDRPLLRVLDGGRPAHRPAAKGSILTDAERQGLAAIDAQLVAARAREDADTGRPVLQPIDVDHLEPDPGELAAIADRWADVIRRIGGAS